VAHVLVVILLLGVVAAAFLAADRQWGN
jgi:hypothetical protein